MNFPDAIRTSFETEYPHGSMLHFKGAGESLGSRNQHYIHYVLKALELGMNNKRLTCLVFPKKGFAAHVAWATLATDTLARKVLPEKVRDFSDEKLGELRPNDLVSTYPGDKVFIWGGETTDNGNKVLIFKVIGKPNSQIGLPVSTFSPLRLNKYPGTKPRPSQIGKLGELKQEPPSAGLDILMPSKSYGNKGLVGVCACLVSDKLTISEFTSQIQIGLNAEGPFTAINESILDKDAQEPSPEECTCLHATDLDNALETLRTTRNLPLGQETPLIIDGLSHIRDFSYIRKLRFSDDRVQRPIVVVAEYSERAHIERLSENFDFWELHNTEIQSE